MKHFYCVTSNKEKAVKNPNFILLRTACKRQGVLFKELTIPPTAYSLGDVPELASGALYRLATSERCRQFTYALHKRNPHVATWYTSQKMTVCRAEWSDLMLSELAGVPVIPTLLGVQPTVTDELLAAITYKLDGFPVVLKAAGGSHGKGVMQIDSPTSLKTVLGHIVKSKKAANFVFRKLIRDATHYRAVVIGNEVVSVVRYLPQKNDLRTNAVKVPKVVPANIPEDWQKIAVLATHQKGTVFGGVDILVDKDNQPYIAEVNTPCNFSRSEHATGDPIADQLVKYLCR